MTKKEFKYLINILFLLIAVAAYFTMRCVPHQSNKVFPQAAKEGSLFYVSRVIDGDTIKLSTGVHVRLIGIDTPESRYNKKLERDAARSRKDINEILKMGKIASGFTKGLVEGKTVRLEFDMDKRDRYGRLLAYVYLEDGTFVNAKIIGRGMPKS